MLKRENENEKSQVIELYRWLFILSTSSLTVLHCILLDEISKIEKLLFTGRREQKTVTWITFNPLLEKGHYHGGKGYPGNSSTRTFKHLRENGIYPSHTQNQPAVLMHKLCGFDLFLFFEKIKISCNPISSVK